VVKVVGLEFECEVLIVDVDVAVLAELQNYLVEYFIFSVCYLSCEFGHADCKDKVKTCLAYKCLFENGIACLLL
jgi:hypothetical protein